LAALVFTFIYWVISTTIAFGFLLGTTKPDFVILAAFLLIPRRWVTIGIYSAARLIAIPTPDII